MPYVHGFLRIQEGGGEIDNALPDGDFGGRPDNSLPGGRPVLPGNALPKPPPGVWPPPNATLPIVPAPPGTPPGVIWPPIGRPPIWSGGVIPPVRPDAGLPPAPVRPGQGLPGEQPGIDNTLPTAPVRPDNSLPSGAFWVVAGIPGVGWRYICVDPSLTPDAPPPPDPSGGGEPVG